MNDIIKQVESLISPVYLVGGAVRDELLGKTPVDFDFATPVNPDDIERRIEESGRRCYAIGKRFGTLGFRIDSQYVEVTTFRKEEYTTNRKPTVQFVSSIDQDLSRRDFTINAIAKRGTKYIDPFGGRDDLSAGTLRAVGNPSVRFREDPLRMLRAARFVSQLGFTIEPDTSKSIAKNAHQILGVSKERWVAELDKLLMGNHVAQGLQALYDTNLLMFMLPELRIQVDYDQNSHWHDLTLWEHTLSTVEMAPCDINMKWAALLHDIGKPSVRTDKPDRSNYVYHDIVGAEMVCGIGKRLKWSNERLHTVTELVKSHLREDSPIRAADNASKKMP